MSSNFPIQIQVINSNYLEDLSGNRRFSFTVRYDINNLNNLIAKASRAEQVEFESQFSQLTQILAQANIKFLKTNNTITAQKSQTVNIKLNGGTIDFNFDNTSDFPDETMRVLISISNQNGQLSFEVGAEQFLTTELPPASTVQPQQTWINSSFSTDMKYVNFDLSGTIFAEKSNDFDNAYVNQPLILFLQAKNNAGQTVYLDQFNFTFGNNQQFSQGINNIFISNDQNINLELFVIGSDGFAYSTMKTLNLTNVDTTPSEPIPTGYHKMPDGTIMKDSDMPVPIPAPTPVTYCVNVYTLDDGGNVLSEHFDSISLQTFQNLLSENKYVFLCEDGIIPTEQQVREFYGYSAPIADSSINSMMVSQSVGAFILKDGRLTGEILYIANTAFNEFYYNKSISSLVQIKSKSGIPIAVKENVLNFTNTERDERIQIDESVGNFSELIVDFYVWKSTSDLRAFSENKQIQVVQEPEDPTSPTCPQGFHKDFSGKCVADDPVGEIPRDKLIDTLKGFLFGTVALSLLARKY